MEDGVKNVRIRLPLIGLIGFIKQAGCNSVNIPEGPINMLWSNSVLCLGTPFIGLMPRFDVS